MRAYVVWWQIQGAPSANLLTHDPQKVGWRGSSWLAHPTTSTSKKGCIELKRGGFRGQRVASGRTLKPKP
jgi:hypothetical protein